MRYFKPKRAIYGLIIVRLQVESLLMKTIFTLKVTMNQVKMKKFFFGIFCRLFGRVLTLRLSQTYICVFRVIFNSFSFKAKLSTFWKLGVSSLFSTLYFEEIEWDFCRLYVLVCYCVANQYSEFTSIFWDHSNRRASSKG